MKSVVPETSISIKLVFTSRAKLPRSDGSRPPRAGRFGGSTSKTDGLRASKSTGSVGHSYSATSTNVTDLIRTPCFVEDIKPIELGLHIAMEDAANARKNLEKASAIVQEISYHRRDPDPGITRTPPLASSAGRGPLRQGPTRSRMLRAAGFRTSINTL
jgi:hypothetical protein